MCGEKAGASAKTKTRMGCRSPWPRAPRRTSFPKVHGCNGLTEARWSPNHQLLGPRAGPAFSHSPSFHTAWPSVASKLLQFPRELLPAPPGVLSV